MADLIARMGGMLVGASVIPLIMVVLDRSWPSVFAITAFIAVVTFLTFCAYVALGGMS